MGRHRCSRCGEVYYLNPNVDYELSCPACGFVEPEKMIGQKSGRSSDLFDD